MAIDTAEKRKSISGVGGPPLIPGVTPNSDKDQEWRQEAGWGYSGIEAWEGIALYKIYRSPGGANDYTLQGSMGEDDAAVDITDQSLSDGTWDYMRTGVSKYGTEGDSSDACRVVIDSGALIPPVGNAPRSLQATAIAGAKIKLEWQYFDGDADATPTGFKVYRNIGGTWTEQDTVALIGGTKNYTWTSDALSDGTRYEYKARTYKTISEVDYEENNDIIVTAVADSTGPAAITGVSFKVDE